MASNYPNVYLEMTGDDYIVKANRAKRLRRAMDDGRIPRRPIIVESKFFSLFFML